MCIEELFNRIEGFSDAELKKIVNEVKEEDLRKSSSIVMGDFFQESISKTERHKGGVHYTSEGNIMKVIKPLFLDDLYEEFREIETSPNLLKEFHNKISSLKFLDPACGCGNFLIVTYKELRELEIKILERLRLYGIDCSSAISLGQFYGIEIDMRSSQLAKVGLWMIERLMRDEDCYSNKCDPIILCANALRIDWNEVVPASELSYIFGNPPFIGSRVMSKEQKEELKEIFCDIKSVGNLDYVCAWFKKSSDIMELNRTIRTCFVSTNSISQGVQVSILWKPLIERGFYINFAYRSFVWDNNTKNNAAVYCVIIGFSLIKECKAIYDNIKGRNIKIIPKSINGYLKDGKNIFVESRNTPLSSDVPPMKSGSMPIDGGHFVLQKKEYEEILSKEPQLKCVLKPYIGAKEFLHNKERWCIWFHNEPRSIIAKSKILQRKIARVEEFRLASKSKSTNQLAKTPLIFAHISHPYSNYLVIPIATSNIRRYIPIGFMDKNTIASDTVQIIPNAGLYHFAILTSSVHMAWMRTFAGRLKNDYRYSKEVVYNNFPWPENVTDKQKSKIEALAQKILDARDLYPKKSLAELYDIDKMPVELRKAHDELDGAVLRLYGYDENITEEQIVLDLFRRYEMLTSVVSDDITRFME